MDSAAAAFGNGVTGFETALAVGGSSDRSLCSSDGACVSVTDQSDAVAARQQAGKQKEEKLLSAVSCESEWQDWEGEKGGRGSSQRAKLPRPEGGVSCPRCGSDDTKFCYYNNYNIKQPRYFCKTCQRYWTVGGTLRNVPIGSGRRKSKTGGIKELEKGGYGTLDPQQGFGVYNNFRNVLDPLIAYGGMVNAGKAHAIGAAFRFPCPSVDSLASNIVKREGPACNSVHSKRRGDEAESQDAGSIEMDKLGVDGMCTGTEHIKSEILAEDGSVDGRRVKMKMSAKNIGRAMAGVPSSGGMYAHTSLEDKDARLAGSSSIEADWYTASAIAAMNQQMAAVMAAASTLGSTPGTSNLASGTSGGSTQSAIDFSSLSQQAQSLHAAHLHAQAAQATQVQFQAHMQAHAQNQVQPQHAQTHLHTHEQVVQATQVALRMQAAQAMSQVAMAGWGQAQMPYWPGMWNPYGQWPATQVSEQGSIPPSNLIGLESAYMTQSNPQPTLAGPLSPSPERTLYDAPEESHPSRDIHDSSTIQNHTADQGPGLSQSIVMPACGLMGVNPWMQIPGLAAMGWGTGACSPSVPNPFGGWMGGTAAPTFTPQFPSHIYGIQTSGLSPMTSEANGLSVGVNTGSKSGLVSATDFSSRKESQVQDSSVF